MNIVQAIKDPNLFRSFIGDDLTTWKPWMVALRALYGLPIRAEASRNLLFECTGRLAETLPSNGFSAALFLIGRRSGKSRIAALVGAFEAALGGHEEKLAKGEKGIVAVCAPTKWQARIVKNYVRAAFDAPLLQAEITAETQDGFELSNGIEIAILAGDFRTVRGPTLVAAIIDEAAFFGVTEESKVRSDTELVRALRPGLATIQGKMILISSPYAKKGWCYEAYRKGFGSGQSPVLVWNCPSRTMNPTLPQEVVDQALQEDRQAALAEYLGQFRDDVAEFLSRSIVEASVVTGRTKLLPREGIEYAAFADLSGGRNDDAALAIAHTDGPKVIVDALYRYKAPFNPHEVVQAMVEEMRAYNVREVTGDNYSAEFTAKAFEACGVTYNKSAKPKSVLYLELLPRLCSGGIELIDNNLLISQIAGLERRTRAGGRDIVDHPKGGKDDLANAVAGVAVTAASERIMVGAF